MSALILLAGLTAFAGKKKILFSVSEADATIYVDGNLVGTGQAELVIDNNQCIKVKVEKVGYLTEILNFCNKKNSPLPPKTYMLTMQIDDAYEATINADFVNRDIEIKTTKPENEAWKLLSQIITNHFDVIEVTDKETGYIRTAWERNLFSRNTIRTRCIVKLSGTDPLTYKVKLISEESGKAQTSVKTDEAFHEYDRILKKYKEVIGEMQSRLGN
jgi:hypothetical protein